MKLYLFICFLSHLVLGQFQWQGGCQTAVMGLLPLLIKQQSDISTMCQDPSLLQPEINKIEGVMTACGLTDWVNSQNDQKVGIIFKAMFGFIKRILCYKEATHYCLPQIIKIVPLQEIMGLFTSGQTPDFTNWNISCSILANDGIRSQICPSGDATSGQARCAKGMVRIFDHNVVKIKHLLRGLDYDSIKDTVKPILKLASDIRLVCRKSSRSDVKSYLNYICDPTESVQKPQICDVHPNNPALNKVKKSYANLLNIKSNYDITLPFRTENMDLATAEARCCGSDCQTAKQTAVKRVWKRIFVITNLLGVDVEKSDIVAIYNGLSDEKKIKFRQKICEDISANSFYNPNNNCEVAIKTIASGQGRRLLDLDSKLEITLTTDIIEGDQDTPFTCEDGSLFLTNDYLNSNSGTDTQEYGETECTASLVAPPTASPIKSPTGPGGAVPTAPLPTEDSAMHVSLSLVPMLSFFIVSTLF
jgi:hypothetical protein